MLPSTLINVSSLLFIIIVGGVCNIYSLYFIINVNNRVTLKDKVTGVLCIMNLCQIPAYSMELYSALVGYISDVSCIFSASIVCVCTYSTIGCFVSLIIVRYLSVILPFRFDWFAKKFSVHLCLTIPLTYGLFFGLAPVFGWGRYGRSRPNSTYCGFNFKYFKEVDCSFFYTTLTFTFFLPLLLTFVCFKQIIRDLKSTALKYSFQYGRQSCLSKSSNKRIFEQYLCFALTGAIFVASWTPYTVLCFCFFYDYRVSLSFEHLAIYLSKSSTISSPIIFSLIEKRIRQGLR